MMTSTIKYLQGDGKMLAEIESLWKILNQYHCERSKHFKEHYSGMTFELRKAQLLNKSRDGKLRVDLAVDQASGSAVGYVVSSMNAQKIGEVESIFVRAEYRGLGIGGSLLTKALAWMDQSGAVEKIVETSIGNEQAWRFYGRFGFLPRKTILKQVKS
jgi:ribosomal protein S18 acetylase RimI-like enzyme